MTQTDKQAHSPTPWRCQPSEGPSGTLPKPREYAVLYHTGPGTLDAGVGLCWHTYGDTAKANARRIVAAVNACEGISTEALEAGVVADRLEALEELSMATTRALMYRQLDKQPHVVKDLQSANDQAKTTIAKAKPEAP